MSRFDALVRHGDGLGAMPLAAGERARFFATARFPGLDCLTAIFRSHVYSLHTHDTYVVGTIEAGCETWSAGGTRHYAGPGDLVFNNPLVVHDGEPLRDGYAYRMTYPTVELVQEIASAISGKRVTATPRFKASSIHDSAGAQMFSDAHAA